MKNPPLTSIVIPLYNAEKFFTSTINSCLSQTYPNIEIIIVDDGSEDRSLELALQYESASIIIRKNKGKGACAARNYGFELSSGQYIQYLDADDLLSPDKISAQVRALEQSPHHVAVCSTAHFSETLENSVITDRDFMFSTNDPSQFLLNLYGANGTSNMVQTSAWLTPRSLIEAAGPWDETLSKDQDGEFFCRAVMASQGVLYTPSVTNFYRKHITGKNVSGGNQRKHIKSQYDALESKARQLSTKKNTREYNQAMALQYKHVAIEAWPTCKDISRKALSKCNDLGGSAYNPVLGGPVIENIKKAFGWKVAKSFTYHAHKIVAQMKNPSGNE